MPLDPPTSPRGAGHLRALAATALLAATAVGGLALREPAPAPPGPPSSSPVARAQAGAVELTASLDRSAVLVGGDGQLRVELALRASAGDAATRLPTDLVVVLDRSGSMQGDPLATAKAAVRDLLGRLGPGDRFALVSYASEARVDAPLAPVSTRARSEWERALAGIPAAGGTNLAEGLDLAHRVALGGRTAGRVTRLIVLSDGHANQGDHSPGGLAARARRAVAGEYVLSTVGIGQGFDEALMGALADAGTGSFYYLPRPDALADVFSAEFASARETAARGLLVEMAPGAGVSVQSASGLPLERQGSLVRFRPGDLFAGQDRRIWVTLRVPTAQVGELELGGVWLRWRDPGGASRELALTALPRVACVAAERDYYASFDEDVYRRADSGDALGQLEEQVALEMRQGRLAEARARVQGFLDQLRDAQRRAFGSESTGDVAAIESLQGTLEAPEAAAPAVQQRLGKQLLEQGRDARRQGGKRR
jgi:Ca-activated chloride channel homolog